MPAFPSRDHQPTDPIPSTVLKWGCDGELSDLDRLSILHRLLAADPFVSELQLQGQEGASSAAHRSDG